jgi:hypothetical protein
LEQSRPTTENRDQKKANRSEQSPIDEANAPGE